MSSYGLERVWMPVNSKNNPFQIVF